MGEKEQLRVVVLVVARAVHFALCFALPLRKAGYYCCEVVYTQLKREIQKVQLALAASSYAAILAVFTANFAFRRAKYLPKYYIPNSLLVPFS